MLKINEDSNVVYNDNTMMGAVFKHSHQSSLGLQLGVGILITVLLGVFLTAICIWRKKIFKQNVTRMRQLSSTFFRRKRERLRQAQKLQVGSEEPNESNGNVIPRNGVGGGTNNNKVDPNGDSVNTGINPSSVLMESKTDPAYLTLERIIPQDGIKAGTNNDNCVTADTVQVHVSIEVSPIHRAENDDIKSESKFLTLERTITQDSTVRKSNEAKNEGNIDKVDGKRFNCDAYDKSIKEPAVQASDTDRKVEVDIEAHRKDTSGQTSNSNAQPDVTTNLETEDWNSCKEIRDNCQTSLRHEDEEASNLYDSSERNHKKLREGGKSKECKHKLHHEESHEEYFSKRPNVVKGSKSLTDHKSRHKWKIEYSSEHGRMLASSDINCSNSDSNQSNSTDREKKTETENDSYDKLSDWTTKYHNDAITNTEQILVSPSHTADDEQTHPNNKPNTRNSRDICSKTNSKPTEKSAYKSSNFSKVKIHRPAVRRKHNSESGSTVSDLYIVSSSLSTKSERNEATQNCSKDPLRKVASDETFNRSAYNTNVSNRTGRPETLSNANSKVRKMAVRRKITLEMKGSDESGYSSCVSDRDRHVSEMSNISIEPISEEDR